MNVVQDITTQAHPVVLRFAELFPVQLAGYQTHGERKGGDLSHIDGDRSHLNRVLIGGSDWREQALKEIEVMRHENLAEELEALRARGRTKELDARAREGLKDPWRASKAGPLREVIVTANKDWFEASDAPSIFGAPAAERALEFQQTAVEWLKNHFGDDVIHARVDHDERACHIHAIIMPREQKTSKRRGRQCLLQPSVHPLIKDYEKAQDDVGAYFSALGLRRGDRGAEARRQARDEDQPLPEWREHIPPSRWREEEAQRLREEAQRLEVERQSVLRRADELIRRLADAEAEKEAAMEARRQAEQREAAAAAREREADAVIAVVEAIEAGIVEFDRNDDQLVAQVRRGLDPAQQDIVARVRSGGDRAQAFIGRIGAVYRQFQSSALAAADARVRAQIEIAGQAISAANAFRKQAIIALPAALRERFRRQSTEADTELLRARERLERVVNTPAESGRTHDPL